MITFDDVEDWIYSQFEDNSHILHGVIHSNGFGHLLRVNGREGGSNTITGSQVMGFWDRICTFLTVRYGFISLFTLVFHHYIVNQ